MKTEKIKIIKKKVADNFIINPSLDGKYDNEPYFKEKTNRVKEIIKKAGVPKF